MMMIKMMIITTPTKLDGAKIHRSVTSLPASL